MAKKEETIEDRYEKILGRPLNYFSIVRVNFRTWSGLYAFNYMTLNGGIRGLLYDANERTYMATIIYPKGSPDVLRAKQMADFVMRSE